MGEVIHHLYHDAQKGIKAVFRKSKSSTVLLHVSNQLLMIK